MTKKKEQIQSLQRQAYRAIEKPRTDNLKALAFNSEKFQSIVYEIKDGHVIVYSGKSGTIAVQLTKLRDLLDELMEIDDVYGGW